MEILCQKIESKIQPPLHSEGWGELKQVNRSALHLSATDFSEVDQERFWSKVNIKGANECWEWTGCRAPSGYGFFQMKSKSLRSHRVCYAITNGEALSKRDILHSCDNPPCCNPAHLSSGTHIENMIDRGKKGRSSGGGIRGEKSRFAKLKPNDVIEIRRLYKSGMRLFELAKMFGVTGPAIKFIVVGKNWAHVQ